MLSFPIEELLDTEDLESITERARSGELQVFGRKDGQGHLLPLRPETFYDFHLCPINAGEVCLIHKRLGPSLVIKDLRYRTPAGRALAEEPEPSSKSEIEQSARGRPGDKKKAASELLKSLFGKNIPGHLTAAQIWRTVIESENYKKLDAHARPQKDSVLRAAGRRK